MPPEEWLTIEYPGHCERTGEVFFLVAAIKELVFVDDPLGKGWDDAEFLLKFYTKDIVKFENSIGQCLLPHNDLHSVLSLLVDYLVENTIHACGLQKLPLINSPEVF